MKFSELKGRAVINLEDASKVGEVEDLLVEQQSRRIVSLKVRTGLFSASKLVPATDIRNVGADAVTISVGTAKESTESSPPLVELTTILGNKVVTDAGTFVGDLHDILLDWTNLAITGYEVRESGLFASTQEFAASAEVSFGKKMITIPAQLLAQPK